MGGISAGGRCSIPPCEHRYARNLGSTPDVGLDQNHKDLLVTLVTCRTILVPDLLTTMSQTFEYPPAFVDYRPLQHHNKVILETLYRLWHHFFLTRLKYGLGKIASLPVTDHRRAGLKTAIVT